MMKPGVLGQWRRDEGGAPRASDEGHMMSGIISIHLQVLAKSGHAAGQRTTRVDPCLSEVGSKSSHRKTQ